MTDWLRSMTTTKMGSYPATRVWCVVPNTLAKRMKDAAKKAIRKQMSTTCPGCLAMCVESSNSHHDETQHLAEIYRCAIDRFIARGGFLPASPLVICRYIAENADTVTARAFKAQIGALAWWHKTQGLPDLTKHHWVSHPLAELKPYSPRSQLEFAPLSSNRSPVFASTSSK